MRTKAMNGAIEYSSMLFSIEAKFKGKRVILYGTTKPVSLPDDESPDRKSPGFGNSLHIKPEIGNVNYIGLIHLHWMGSAKVAMGRGEDNSTFSSADIEIMDHHLNANRIFYVLGSKGGLFGRYADNYFPVKNGFPDERAGERNHPVDGGYYMKNKGQPVDCPCYKKN